MADAAGYDLFRLRERGHAKAVSGPCGPLTPGLQNSGSAVQRRSRAFLTWMPPALALAVDRRHPPVLLSL